MRCNVCNVGVFWPNGWMDQDATRYGVGLDTGHIVLDGDPAFPPERGTVPPIFGPCLLWPNGWMDQDATLYGSRPRPRPHCVRWVPSPPRKGHSSPLSFRPMSLWPGSPILDTAELLYIFESSLICMERRKPDTSDFVHG